MRRGGQLGWMVLAALVWVGQASALRGGLINETAPIAGHPAIIGGDAGDGGLATEAFLHMPQNAAFDAAGNLYIADCYNHKIRRVDAVTQTITTVVGNGTDGAGGDGGPATEASLGFLFNIAVDGPGNIYISDTNNNRVRRVDAATGVITTVAGGGVGGSDGRPATQSGLLSPGGVAVDRHGNLYLTEQEGIQRVRRVDAATGIITTVAGGGTLSGALAEGVPATSVQLPWLWGIALDQAGNLLLTQPYAYRVRRVDAATGIITTVAGTGIAEHTGDGGPATEAAVDVPWGVTVDRQGNVYITESNGSRGRVRCVDGATGIITSIVGTGQSQYAYTGVPVSADSVNLSNPTGLALNGSGDLFITDYGFSTVWRVQGIAVANQAPVADAGADQDAAPAAPGTVDGGASSDAEADSLSFVWSAPQGIILSDVSAVQPTFTTPSTPGAYAFTLRVHDGLAESRPDTVVVNVVVNDSSLADAGPDQDVAAGVAVQLDGSASHNLANLPLTYVWTAPAGILLSDSTAAQPTFTSPLIAGRYLLTLVVSSATSVSAPDTVVITVSGPHMPVADAGPDQTVPRRSWVILDGKASADSLGHPLLYLWTVPDSLYVEGLGTAQPQFRFGDRADTLTFVLRVSDGTFLSTPDTVLISATNSAPLAYGPADRTVTPGTVVWLHGRGDDADGDSLRFAWTGPDSVALAVPAPADVRFTSPSAPGAYAFVLTVGDGFVVSEPDTVWVTVAEPAVARWSVQIAASTADGRRMSVNAGVADNATEGLDPDYAENELPPVPPSDTFDLRWESSAPLAGLDSDYRGPAADSAGAVWNLAVQFGAADGPVTLAWAPAQFPAEGTFRIVDAATGGQWINFDPRAYTSYSLIEPGATRLLLKYQPQAMVTHTFALPGRWSMVSLPAAIVPPTVAALFPNRLGMFGFSSSYYEATSFAPGEGYWLNLPDSTQTTLTGPAYPDTVLHRYLPSHWSMVGPGSRPVDVGALMAQSPQIISVYGYQGGYQQVTTMQPGRAYWVNLRQSAWVDLTGLGSGMPAPRLATPVPAAPGTVVWAEGATGRQAIQLGVGADRLVELPPVPPTGLFDVRVEVAPGLAALQVPTAPGTYPLHLQGGVERLRWDAAAGAGWELQVGSTRVPLVGAGELAVADGQPVALVYAARPQATLLRNAYPNPFNPSTTIHYELAAAGAVRLSLYSVTGQWVRDLVAAPQAAGLYSVAWDGRDSAGLAVANGVYLCQLEAGGSRQMIRLMLLK